MKAIIHLYLTLSIISCSSVLPVKKQEQDQLYQDKYLSAMASLYDNCSIKYLEEKYGNLNRVYKKDSIFDYYSLTSFTLRNDNNRIEDALSWNSGVNRCAEYTEGFPSLDYSGAESAFWLKKEKPFNTLPHHEKLPMKYEQINETRKSVMKYCNLRAKKGEYKRVYAFFSANNSGEFYLSHTSENKCNKKIKLRGIPPYQNQEQLKIQLF